MGRGATLRALFSRRKMKVKTKRGGFFYDGRTVAIDEELDVPKEVGESWINNDMAEEVKPSRSTRRQRQASETTEAAGPSEARQRG